MIPVFEYRRQWNARQPEFMSAIQKVLDSGQLILGDEVRSFEASMARFFQRAHAIGVNSGTDALVLALRSLGVGQGDEVITVPNSAVPTAAAIKIVGARPVFVDVEPDTLLIDGKQIESACTAATKAIIPVHLHGLCADMDTLVPLSQKLGIPLIEDCAQSMGATFHGQQAGTFGAIACFSFYPTKNLGAYGDGGLCVTDSEELAKSLRRQRMYGFDDSPIAQIDGLNSRLDELQAAILQVKLRYFETDMSKRRFLAARYLHHLASIRLKLPVEPRGRQHAWHLFVVRVHDRDAVKSALVKRGIQTGIHYSTPLHLMPAFRDLGYREGDFPVAEQAARELLTLPLFPELTEAEQDQVIQTLTEVIP